jgi:hypothetical protein
MKENVSSANSEKPESFIKIAKPAYLIKAIEQSNNERLAQLGKDQAEYSKNVKPDSDPSVKEKINYINEGIFKCEYKLSQFKKYFEPLSFPVTAKTLHLHKFDDWLRIKRMDSPYDERDRAEYETFVQGYLYYFEQHVITSKRQRENKKYTLYFDWGETSFGKYDLIIYIRSLETPVYNDYVREGISMASPPSVTDPVPPPPPPPPPRTR